MNSEERWDLVDRVVQIAPDFQNELYELLISVEDEISDAWENGFFYRGEVDRYYPELFESANTVYFISNGNYIKIGVSNNPYKRLQQLQTSSSFSLRILRIIVLPSREMALKLEKKLHFMFDFYRTSGEWFEQRPILGKLMKMSDEKLLELVVA